MSPRRALGVRLGSATLASLCMLALTAAPAKTDSVLGFTTTGYRHPGSPSLETMGRFASLVSARIMRLEVRWKVVEPDADLLGNPLRRRWHQYDRAVDSLRKAGVRPVLLLSDAPDWADGPLGLDLCRGIHCPPDSTHLRQWSEFAQRVARHYRNDAVAIEIWNAPNTVGWWPTLGGPNPEEYARMFEVAARAIHRAVPGMPVLFGSVGYFSSGNVEGRYMTIPTFMRRFYSAVDRRVLRRPDGFSFHPYPAEGELRRLDGQFATIMRQVTRIRNSSDPRRLLWATETGVSTTGRKNLSERAQARGLLNVIDALDRRRDVVATIVHTLVEVTKGRRDEIEPGYGVMRRGQNGIPVPKTAYCALAERAGTSLSAIGCPPPPPPGRCQIKGSPRRDVLRGTSLAEVICGGRGNDRIKGRGGDDQLIGGKDDDELIGGGGADRLLGGPGDDRLEGGRGADLVRGGSGDDLLIGGRGVDKCVGGEGRDRFRGCEKKRR